MKIETAIEIKHYESDNGKSILVRDTIGDRRIVRENNPIYDLLNTFGDKSKISFKEISDRLQYKEFEYLFSDNLVEINHYKTKDILMSETYTSEPYAIFANVKDRFEDIESSFNEYENEFDLFSFDSTKRLKYMKSMLSYSERLVIKPGVSESYNTGLYTNRVNLASYNRSRDHTTITLLGVNYDAKRVGDDVSVSIEVTDITM